MPISALIARRRGTASAPRAASGSRKWRWAAACGLAGGLALCLSVPSTALAAQAATVLPLKLTGPLEPPVTTALEAAVTQALRDQRILDVATSERDAILTSEPNLAGCLSELCMERIGRLLDSQLVLRAQVTFNGAAATPAKGRPAAASPAGDGNWELRVDVFDVEVGAIGASVRSDCAACSPARAAQTLSELVGRGVLESASRPRGFLAVTSLPSNAVVFVDGTELGFTPYKRLAFIGKHQIVVRSTGYRSYQAEAVVDESKKQQLSVSLQSGADPVTVVTVEKPTTPLYKKWWFWTVIGGAALVAGGVTAGVVLGTREIVPNGTPGPVNINF